MSILFCTFVVQMAIVPCVTTNKYSYMETKNETAKRMYVLTFISRHKYCVERCIERESFVDVINLVLEMCQVHDYKVIIQRETFIDGVRKLPVVCEFFPSNYYQMEK